MNVNGTGPPTEWYEVETYENDLDESKVPESPSPLRGTFFMFPVARCLILVLFIVRPTSDKIYVMWSPPLSQNIKIRNYIIGWGKGVPDNASEALDEKQRSFVIHSVGKL